MKKRCIALTALLVFLLSVLGGVSSALASDANLLENGDFESGTIEPWTVSSGNSVSLTAFSHSGSGALETANLYGVSHNNAVSVEGGKQYLCSAWVRPEEDDVRIAPSIKNPAAVQAIDGKWCDENGNPVTYWVYDNAKCLTRYNSGKWSLLEVIVTVPSDANEANLSFVAYDSGTDWKQTKTKKYYIDDAYFGEIIADGAIIGDDEIHSGLNSVSGNYNITIGNSRGGTAGVSASDVSCSATLDTASVQKGVTFENGVLTVPRSDEDYTITLTAEISGKVNGADTVSSFTKTKEIKVLAFDPYANLLENGDFESGASTGFGGLSSIKAWEDTTLTGGKYSAYGARIFKDLTDFPQDNGKYYILSADFMPIDQKMDIHAAISTFYTDNETFVKKTYEPNVWYNVQSVAKRTAYYASDGTYCIPSIGLSAFDSGAWSQANGNMMYIDNLYLTELKAVSQIKGAAIIERPQKSVTSSFLVNVTNNFGGTAGIGATTSEWSLVDENGNPASVDGVTIDSSGVVHIDENAKACEIYVKASSETQAMLDYRGNNNARTLGDKLKSEAVKKVIIEDYNKFANILKNFSFENGTEDWNPYGVCDIVTDDTVSGDNAVCLSGEMKQFAAVEPDTYYIFSYKYKPATSVKMCSGIWGYTPDIEEYASPNGQTNGKWLTDNSKDLYAAEEWDTFEMGFKTDSDAKNILVKLTTYTHSWKSSRDLKLYIDDVVLRKAGELKENSVSSLQNYVKYECDINFENASNENYSVFLNGTGGSGMLVKLQDGRITMGQGGVIYTDTPTGTYHIDAVLDYDKNNAPITVTYPDGRKIQRASEAYFFGSESAESVAVFTPYKTENISNIKCNLYDASYNPEKIYRGDINIYNGETVLEDWDNVSVKANKISVDFGTPLLPKETLDASVKIIGKEDNGSIAVSQSAYENGIYTMNIGALEPECTYAVVFDNAVLSSNENCEYEFKTQKASSVKIGGIKCGTDDIKSLSQIGKDSLLTLTAVGSNIGEDEQGIQIIAVYYGKGRKITDCKVIKTDVIESGAEDSVLTCEFSLGDVSNTGEVRLYIWDSFNNLKPLSEAFCLR